MAYLCILPLSGRRLWASGDIRNIEIRNCTVLEAARGQACLLYTSYVDKFPFSNGEPAPYAEWIRTHNSTGTVTDLSLIHI